MTRSISVMKLVMSLGMIVFLGAMVAAGTGAFFSDTETSEANVFTAGALDLKVDSVGHVNGLVCFDGLWHPESVVAWNENTDELELNGNDVPTAIADYNTANPANVPQAGDQCASTWTLTDLGPEKFFYFEDLKPGDHGENTISLHVENNDAYACVIIDDMVDADNDQTEPELEDGDDTSDQGELSQELRFFAWADDGDNIWEDGEDMLFSNTEGPASDVIDGVVYPLFTPQTGPIAGAETEYVGLYWCYGDITVDENANTLACDGSVVTNLTQTDSLTSSFTFYVEQARNNENFQCPTIDRTPAETVGAVLGAYVAPTPSDCNFTVENDESIQASLDVAATDDTICVANSYTGVGDDAPIRVEGMGITLAALTQGVTLDVPVVLSGNGVTVTGFTGSIGQAESPSEVTAFYFDNDATNATLSYNTVNGSGSGAAVLTESGADNTGSVISNNVLAGAVQGIYLNPHTGIITIENNDIDDNVAGIGNLTGALVQFNEFEHGTPGSEAIGAGVDSFGDYDGSTVQFNNFLDGTRINAYTGGSPITVDAPNNYFSPDGGVIQAPTNVDFTPESLVMFNHN